MEHLTDQEKINPWAEYYEAKSQSEKEAILKKILPDITPKELEIMRRKMPVPEEQPRPTWDDFFAATKRQDKEAILQKIFNGSLTPEEIEMFFPID